MEELGHERRVLPFARLTAFVMHHVQELPLSRLHRGIASSSSRLQLRRGVADMLRFFNVLETHGITPEAYAAYLAEKGEDSEAAEVYRVYRELLARHDLASWDALPMELLEMLQADPVCLSAVTGEYTDLVVDGVDQLSPAMLRLVSLLVRAPSMESSTAVSGSLWQPSPRSEQLLAMIETSQGRRVDCVSAQVETAKEDVRTRRQSWRTRLDISTNSKTKPKTTKTKAKTKPGEVESTPNSPSVLHPTALPCPVPITCLRFPTFADEVGAIADHIKTLLEQEDVAPSEIAVFCATRSDVNNCMDALQAHGIEVRGRRGVSSSEPVQHLFDEPGVDAIFSFLVALCFPSDTKHLYNVLRSEYFGISALHLSRIMERHYHHSTHATLIDVLQSFVDSNGASLVSVPDHEVVKTVAAVRQVLELFKLCRASCHSKTVQELVQLVLDQAGQLSRVLDPSSSRDARHALALAEFLREIDAAQRIVQSPFVPFVVPYLLQLHTARATVSRPERDDSHVQDDGGVSVLPLTPAGAAELHERVLSKHERLRLAVLMGMRDSKFPGRLQRITWPLPEGLLLPPLPVQTRDEWLRNCETLVTDLLSACDPRQVILSYALVAAQSTAKRPETISRVLAPLWIEPSTPDEATPMFPSPPPPSPPPPATDSSTPETNPPAMPTTSFTPSHLSYSQISEYQRCPQQYYLARVLRLRDESDDTRTTPAMMFGRAIHEALAAFARSLQQHETREQAHAAAVSALETTWRQTGFLSRQQEALFRARARTALESFIAQSASTECSEVLAVEQAFECWLPGTDVPLRGVWDRIDRLADGRVVIREFKSQSSADGLRTQLDRVAQDSLQLQLYMVAYELLHGEAPSGASLEVVSCADKPPAPGFVAYSTDVRAHALEAASAAAEAIQAGRFEPTPSFAACSTCAFAGTVCRAGVNVDHSNVQSTTASFPGQRRVRASN
ncbi:hypothetical protein PINS_up007785 [Pythium insidiosum]|nr:hypothetical protein PINS_up007785 [Pythium insidiosum]